MAIAWIDSTLQHREPPPLGDIYAGLQKFRANANDPSDPTKRVDVVDELTGSHVGFLTKLPLPIGKAVPSQPSRPECAARMRAEANGSEGGPCGPAWFP